MKRRAFLKAAAVAVSTAARPCSLEAAQADPSPAKLPRWRGFNLLEKFIYSKNGNGPFQESDFELMAQWGFDFVRLPMDYRCWTEDAAATEFKEETLKHIDQAVAWGKQYKIHVNLNFHRAPGYCVNPPKEALNLWEDPKAQEQFSRHWAFFADRYKGLPSRQISFDLVNEPAGTENAKYAAVVEKAVRAIRAVDPARLIIADGNQWGTKPVPEIAHLKVGQSTRGYQPFQLTHYKAGWVGGSDRWPEPTWPLGDYDAAKHWREQVEPWKQLEAKGVGVHVGEWGAFSHTPHKVVLAWMKDMLENWRKAGWGWSLWNLRGAFGVLDSGRKDVAYEEVKGRKLDKAMLEILRAG